MTTSLVKPGLKTALAESLYQEILTNSNNYYYFLGNTVAWNGTDTPAVPQITSAYEQSVRQDMIFMKKITAADIAFTIPRYDWTEGEVYDKYDDLVGHTIEVSGCTGTIDTVTGKSYIVADPGTFDVSMLGVGYTAVGTGIAPGSKVTAVSDDRVAVSLPHTGTISSTVKFINYSLSGADSLATAKMYCVTSDYRVYKCLDNNGGAPSTSKPYSTSLTPITTADGYVWKYMYTIPASLINKFMTATDMPVTTAIRSQYYNRGSLSTVAVDSYGSGYAPGDYLTVSGNGYLRDNPLKITSAVIVDVGSGYLTAPSVEVSDPFDTVPFEFDTEYLLGQHVKTSANKIYEVVAPGTSSTSVTPVHTGAEPLINGTLSLKFVGLTPTITTTISGGEVVSAPMSGIIGYINVISPGYGYSSDAPPSITISSTTGSGASATAVVVGGRINQIVLSNRGSGYTAGTTTATVSSPFTTFTSWAANATVAVDTIVRVIGTRSTRYYKVIVGGTLGTTAPSNLNTSPVTNFTNGTATLLFVGQDAKIEVEMYYGFGYSQPPVATVQPPIAFNTDEENPPLVRQWVAGAEMTTGDVVEYGGRFYQLTTPQSNTPLSATPPLHGSGTETIGDIDFQFIANTARIDFGTEQTQAKLAPIIENGQITSVIAVEPGVGYTVANITAETLGQGSGAVLRAITTYGDLDSRQANVELLAVPGTIDSIEIINPGGGYVGSPAVTIDGDGVGATAEAFVEDGALTRIIVTNPGSRYTKATITIAAPTSTEPGSQFQAYARAIVSPTRGHGKNAITELFATDLTLSANVSTEKNQGLTVTNDYRQVGVLKNPSKYGSEQRFNDSTGTACFAVTGEFIDVVRDQLLTDKDGNRFRVVAVAASGQLKTLVIQSLDNSTLADNDVLSHGNGNQTTIVARYAPPTVDKYSGDMLFIDNRTPFLPKSDQTISFKTVIKL